MNIRRQDRHFGASNGVISRVVPVFSEKCLSFERRDALKMLLREPHKEVATRFRDAVLKER